MLREAPHGYIAYSINDEATADKITRAIINEFDTQAIYIETRRLALNPSDSLIEDMKNAIKTCNFFLILVSRNSSKSKWVDIAFKYALRNELKSNRPKIIPILIDKCPLPQNLTHYKFYDLTDNIDEELAETCKEIKEKIMSVIT